MLSREGIIHREWRLRSQTVKVISNLFGEAEIDLFLSEENAHCLLFFTLTTVNLIGDLLLSHLLKGWKNAFPPVKIQ